MVSEEAPHERSEPTVTKAADDQLDEALEESFPASDPPASWSGRPSTEPVEKPEVAGDQGPA
jgi:hypothetical protein